MKIIEALKGVKNLQRKSADIVLKVRDNCALSSIETEKYPDTPKQINEWIQAHSDVLKEILRLRVAIQKTNIEVNVTIDIDGKHVTKSIAAWIHRRRDLAKSELSMWMSLSDRGIKEGKIKGPTGEEMILSIKRFYDPVVRDIKRELFTSEPSYIDAQLEIVNAVTDLIE